MLVAQQHPIGIAIVRDADVSAQFTHLLPQELRVHRTAFLIDVCAIRLIAIDKHFGAQLTQDAWSRFVGGPVGAIDDYTQAFECKAARNRRFRKFNVTP